MGGGGVVRVQGGNRGGEKNKAKSKERAGVQPAGYALRGKRGKRVTRAQSDRV